PTYLFPDDSGLLRILVPKVSSVRYIGFVEGCMDAAGCEAESAPTERVADALLSFRTEDFFDDLTGVRGFFQTSVRSDETGKFEVEVLPGTYEVVVTASGGQHGVLAETVRFEPRGLEEVRGQVFVLPPRTPAAGMVVAPDQRAVADAVVQATALGLAVGAVPAARYSRSADTVSAAEGTFRLGLDVGTYDFVVKPPPESGFPWVA